MDACFETLHSFCGDMPRSYPNSSSGETSYAECETTSDDSTPDSSYLDTSSRGLIQNLLSKEPAAKRFKAENGEAVATPSLPNYSRNALFSAILLNDVKSVKLNLDDKPSLDIVTYKRMSPLHIAAQIGNIQIINELLYYGFDVSVLDADNRTPLHIAAERGLKEVVRLFLNNRADSNAFNKHGFVPLHTAVHNSNFKLVKAGDVKSDGVIITNEQARIENDKHFSMYFAVIAELLSCPSTDINISSSLGKTALYLAVVGVNATFAFRLVELLLNHNADPNIMNVSGKTALSRAMTLERVNIVEALLKNGADVDVSLNQSQTTPIMWGISRCRHDIVNQLLTYATFNVNDPNLCPSHASLLHYAAEVSNAGTNRVLINAGAVVTMQNEVGKTPFLQSPVNHQTILASRKLFIEHLLRVECLDMYVIKEAEMSLIHSVFDLELHFMKLKSELLGLRATQIPGTPFKFYDFFVSSDHSAGLLIQNMSVQKYCTSRALMKLFPGFGRIMVDRYAAGQVRSELVMNNKAIANVERAFFYDRAKTAFRNCHPAATSRITQFLSKRDPHPSASSVKKIIQFLNNRDLKHLIMAYDPVSNLR